MHNFCYIEVCGYNPEDEIDMLSEMKKAGIRTKTITSSVENGPSILGELDYSSDQEKERQRQLSKITVQMFKTSLRPRVINIWPVPTENTAIVNKRSDFLDYIYDRS